MKTKQQNEKKEFDTVKTFRKIKDQVSKDLKGMSFKEIKEYLKKESSKTTSRVEVTYLASYRDFVFLSKICILVLYFIVKLNE